MAKERMITICPKCGSDNVIGETNAAYAITGLFNQYKECRNCGHHGMAFPEIPKSEVPKEPMKIEQTKERTLTETSFGQGYFKYFLFFVIPFLILIFIYFLLSI